MSKTNSAIAVHACGFESENKICEIGKSRLNEAAIKAMAAGINNIIFSGGVTYKKDSAFLAHLMGKFLREAPWYKYVNLNIDYAVDCFDSSTDIQNFIKTAKEKRLSRLRLFINTRRFLFSIFIFLHDRVKR